MPIRAWLRLFPARYAGYSYHEYLYDYEKARKAIVKVGADFDWDIVSPGLGMDGFALSLAFGEHPDLALAVRFITGPVHDALGERYGRFPGRELPENAPFQFIGGEYMTTEEYDALIGNPAKFIAEVVLTRICKNLEKPGSVTAMRSLITLGIEISRYRVALASIAEDLRRLGFPMPSLSSAYDPFDFIADFLRGIKNIMLDVHRMPDKVKQACESLTPLIAKIGVSGKQAGAQYAFIPLHLNEYLSPKLYNELYWPTLKRVINELINAGLTPLVFYEGHHDAHLKTILELPKGKTIACFQRTDLRKAKEVLGGHTSIMGGIPASLLIGGSSAKVEEYTKKLLEDLKPGGGFILNGSEVGIPDEAKPENVKAMVETTVKYGRY